MEIKFNSKGISILIAAMFVGFVGAEVLFFLIGGGSWSGIGSFLVNEAMWVSEPFEFTFMSGFIALGILSGLYVKTCKPDFQPTFQKIAIGVAVICSILMLPFTWSLQPFPAGFINLLVVVLMIWIWFNIPSEAQSDEGGTGEVS